MLAPVKAHSTEEVPLLPTPDDPGHDGDAWEEARIQAQLESDLLQKLDKRMVPFRILSVLAHLARNTVCIAALFGFQEALNLTPVKFFLVIAAYHLGQMYAWALSALLRDDARWPYYHTSWLARLARERPVVGPVSALGIGASSVLMGISETFTQACLARVVLGFSAAIFWASQVELKKEWYKREPPAPSAHIVPLSHFVGLLAAAVVVSTRPDAASEMVIWKRLFYLHSALTTSFALYAWYRLPDLPESAAWLSQPERDLIKKWSADRQQLEEVRPGTETDIDATGDSTPWYRRRHPVLKMVFLGCCQIAVSQLRSFETFWPLIFFSAVPIDKLNGVHLFLSSSAWAVPAQVTLLFSRRWRRLQTTPLKHFLKDMSMTFAISIFTAGLGFNFPVFTEDKGFRVAYIFMIPMVYIAKVPYDTIYAAGAAGLASSISPWQRPLALLYLQLCSIVGTILGYFIWIVGNDRPFYSRGAASSAGGIGLVVLAFVWWYDEALQAMLRKSASSISAETPSAEGRTDTDDSQQRV